MDEGDVYNRLAGSIAPEIWGHEDVKKVGGGWRLSRLWLFPALLQPGRVWQPWPSNLLPAPPRLALLRSLQLRPVNVWCCAGHGLAAWALASVGVLL
jgi:hypothetical protein